MTLQARIGFGLVLAILSFPAAPLAAQARPLSAIREIDKSYGISIQPPVDTYVERQGVDPYLMKFIDLDSRFTIFFGVHQTRAGVTLKELASHARKQIPQIVGDTGLVEQKGKLIAEHPAVVMEFLFMKPDVEVLGTQQDPAPRFLRRAYILIATDRFLLIETECSANEKDMVRATFDAMLDSLELDQIEAVDADRRSAEERSHDWLRRLSPRYVHGRLIDRQLMRMIETSGPRRGRDVGWMFIRQLVSKDDPDGRYDRPGVVVIVQMRMFQPKMTVDSDARYFVSDDRDYEEWSATTTERPSDVHEPQVTTVETGIRTGGKIMIRRETAEKSNPRAFGNSRFTPTGRTKTESNTYTQPDAAYLSQAEAWMLPQLLPADQRATYGFYAYNRSRRKIIYRNERLTPLLDGFDISTTLSPNEPPLRSSFDAFGRIEQYTLSPKLRLVPTSQAELRRLWPNR